MKIVCLNCGADVTFKPEKQKCYCEYCDTYMDPDDFIFNEHEKNNYNLFTCSACGAELIENETELISKCLYCDSENFNRNKFYDGFAADRIIPFKIAKEDLYTYYSKFLKKHNFFPREFEEQFDFEEIKGIYIPYVLFSWNYKMYIEENLNHIHTGTENVFKDLGKEFDNKIMNLLEPYDKSLLKKFNPAYLAGFFAEKTNDDIVFLEKKCEKEIGIRIYDKKEFQRALEQYEREIEKSNHKEEIKFELRKNKREIILLPAWFFIKKNKGITYFFALNGENGKMVCKFKDGQKEKLIFDNDNKDIYVGQKDFSNEYAEIENIKLKRNKSVYDNKKRNNKIIIIIGSVIFLLLFIFLSAVRFFVFSLLLISLPICLTILIKKIYEIIKNEILK